MSQRPYKLHRNAPWLVSIIEGLFALPFARTTEVGARTLVHAALWGTKDDVNGKFLNNSRVEEESDFALSKEGRELEAKIWVRDCWLPPSVLTGWSDVRAVCLERNP
jgi:hypothetical protein